MHGDKHSDPPHGDQQGLISPKPDMEDGMHDYDKMDRLEEMIETFCEGLDEKMHGDKHSDSDHDDEKDDDDSDRDHGHVKDMWLCMQAKQMAWDLKEYIHGDDHDKMRQSRAWMKEIKEMRSEWGMDGASNLAMAGAAMIVAISALSF